MPRKKSTKQDLGRIIILPLSQASLWLSKKLLEHVLKSIGKVSGESVLILLLRIVLDFTLGNLTGLQFAWL